MNLRNLPLLDLDCGILIHKIHNILYNSHFEQCVHDYVSEIMARGLAADFSWSSFLFSLVFG